MWCANSWRLSVNRSGASTGPVGEVLPRQPNLTILHRFAANSRGACVLGEPAWSTDTSRTVSTRPWRGLLQSDGDCVQYESCSPSLVPSTSQNYSPDLADIKRAEQDVGSSSLHGDAVRGRAALFRATPPRPSRR